MGGAVGVSAETAYRFGDLDWWQIGLFAIALGAIFGLILNVGVWFVWSIFGGFFARRRDKTEVHDGGA